VSRRDLEDRDYTDRQVRQLRDDINQLVTGMHKVGVKNMADYETRLRGVDRRLGELEAWAKARNAVASASGRSRALVWTAVGGPVVSAVVTWVLTRR